MIVNAELHAHRVARKKSRKPQISGRDVSLSVPGTVQNALRKALVLENVPGTEFDDFVWIIAHESGGRVNVRNAHSSARGLFQLLSAQYKLNPRGEASFGNEVEECQGGIRYIKSPVSFRESSAAILGTTSLVLTRMKTLLRLTIAAWLALAGAHAMPADEPAQEAAFKAFPIKERFSGQVAQPHLVTKQDKEFRTALQQAAKTKPNFAGHYILTNIGCGASCVMTAALDARSGRVTWLPFTLCCWNEDVQEPVTFRVDSDLVILEGRKNEGAAGTWLFRLKGGEFVPVDSHSASRH